MSERYSLEELKAMSDEKLWMSWADGDFPFDRANCTHCLTQHHGGSRIGCHFERHQALVEQVERIPYISGNPTLPAMGTSTSPSPKMLRDHLEELYALRLFYDHLYPQPAQAASEEEQAFARMEEDFHDSRANTR